MINRVWACFLALDDPYYTMLNQLYVENDLYEAVRQQFDMSPTTFERHRKKALTLIAEYVDSQLSVSEIMSMSHSNKPKLNSRAPTHDMPGQIDMMDFYMCRIPVHKIGGTCMYKTRTYTNITNENRRKIQELLNDNSNISIMGIAEELEIEYSTIYRRLNVELMLMDIMTLIMLKKI